MPATEPPRGGGGQEGATLHPSGSRPGGDLREGSGREEGREENARRAGVRESQSLTQQQQLELAARVLLVPAKLPLDFGADALRLLLLRGQAAAAGHGARCTRRRDAVPRAPVLRRPLARPSRDRHPGSERKGRDLFDLGQYEAWPSEAQSAPRGSMPRRGRIQSARNLRGSPQLRAHQPHTRPGEGGGLAERMGVRPAPGRCARPLAQEADTRSGGADRAGKVGASVPGGENGISASR